MTIQKAIKSLQSAIDGHETRIEIYNLAIAALQAQAERDNPQPLISRNQINKYRSE